MKAIDFGAEESKTLKALVYGKPGSGKTNIGVSAPNPLILLNEQQALQNIKSAAKRLGRPVPATLAVESLDDYRAVVTAFKGDRNKPFQVLDGHGKVALEMATWPESVVMDSVSEAMELVSEEIRRQSPPKIGKDGLPVDSERYWNVLKDRGSKLIRAYRDLPVHVLFLALLSDKETGEGEEKSRWVGPLMPMKALPTVLMAAVNVVGITYRKRGDEVVEVGKKADGKPILDRPMVYGIATTGYDYMELKPYPPLRPYEVTDFSSWVRRVNDDDDGSTSPPPMGATAALTD